MSLEFKQIELKESNLDESGFFTGYGSVFGVKDFGGDVVERGAFSGSLSDLSAKGRFPAMLWQHNHDMPVGAYTKMVEDDNGLLLEGRLALKTRAGSEAYEFIKMGAISGLSIGYTVQERQFKDGVRHLKQLSLFEVSLVTIPMNDSARINGVKSLESIMSLSDAEERLRDAGFSRAEAKAFISKVKSCNQRDADSVDLDGVKNALLNSGLFK